MLQMESLGQFVRQVPSAACAPIMAFAAWSMQLKAHLRRPEVGQVRIGLPPVPGSSLVHYSEQHACLGP